MDEELWKERFKKLESILGGIFVVVIFFFGYTYRDHNSTGLIACYFSLFAISTIVIVGSTLVMSKDQILEQYKYDKPEDLLGEIVEFVEVTKRTIVQIAKDFFDAKFEDAWERLKTYFNTHLKLVLYTPLACFSLLGIMHFFGYSIWDEDKGVIAVAFTMGVIYFLQTAPLNYKKRGYIGNSVEKIKEFTEIAKNSRTECERILNEEGKFVQEEWDIQHQIEQVAIENINNHNELVQTMSGTHKMREKIAPILTSMMGLVTWIMRLAGVGIF